MGRCARVQAVVEELELVKCLDTIIGGSEVLYHVKVTLFKPKVLYINAMSGFVYTSAVSV